MKEVLHFLRELDAHNERPWFQAHKSDYLSAKARVEALAGELIRGIRTFDETIGPLAPADCTYRIYRDTRFSKDKSPYKTHMGIYINRGGKKSGYSGYYFHIGGGEPSMIAAGDYQTEPAVLKILREDISMGGGDFRKILGGVDPALHLDLSSALKRVPAGFPADSPDADFLKLKVFCLVGDIDDRFLLAPSLPERVCDLFRTTRPFLDYINRAIDFVREESALSR